MTTAQLIRSKAVKLAPEKLSELRKEAARRRVAFKKSGGLKAAQKRLSKFYSGVDWDLIERYSE